MHSRVTRIGAATLAGTLLAVIATARADSLTIGFESPYTTGSIDGQQGWGGQNPPGIAISPSIDQEVSTLSPRTGLQDFRISSVFTSGSFGDQTFSPSLINRAGEPGSIDGGFAGGTLQPRFTSTIFFRSATGSAQDSHAVISPDRGDGARMSWIQVSDNVVDPGDGRQGLSVSFYEYRVPGMSQVCDGGADGENKCFVFTVLATNLTRNVYHQIDVEMEFYDGKATDVVRVSVDGGPAYRGTSWEDYFPNNQPGDFPTDPPPVDSLLFRVGGLAEGNAGEGFLFDDVSYASTACLAATRYVKTTGDDTFNDCRDAAEPCLTVQHAVDVACVGDLVEVGIGMFAEAVTIAKTVTVNGTGPATTKIQAPGTLPANGTIVTISGASTSVEMRNLTVAGPGASGCGSIRAGIFVRDDATANIHDNAIRDVRDAPLSGCQNGIGILVGSGALSTTGNATIQDNVITGYQKGGIAVVNNSVATIDGNTVTGVSNTPLIAQNGIQVSGGASAQVTGNDVSDNLCDHATCGLNGYQSAGILLFDHALPMTVSGNTVTSNDMGIYHFTTDGPGSTAITNNIVTGSRFEGVFLDQGTAALTGNTISGGATYGIQVFSFTVADGATGDSIGTISCNKIQNNLGAGIELEDADPMDTFEPTISGSNNAISGNGMGAVNTTAATQNLENNYWGSGSGPNPPGSGDTVSAGIDAVPFLTQVPVCIACTVNADCTNGLACDGGETCNAGSCQAGSPIICTPTQCQASSICQEPSGTCATTPKPNGVLCSDGAACTVGDTCQSGVCTPGPGADSDNDGDCDDEEASCGCNGMDPNEVCVLPNRLIGLPGNGVGEVLINWHTPTVRKPSQAADPSCQDAGVCTGGRCTAGQINDICTVNSDCNLAANTCRIIVNWADTADLTVSFAKVGHTDQTALFNPAPGCSQKIDLPLDPARATNRLRVKAKGTIDGRLRQDRDTIIYKQ